MKLGIQSVCTADLEIDGVVSLAKDVGLDGLELAAAYLGRFRGEPDGPEWHISSADTLASAEKAALLAGKAGVEIFAFASRCGVEELEKFESLCRAAASIGCSFVRIGCGSYDPKLGYWPSMDRSRKQLGKAIEVSRRHGVRAVVELHDNTMADGVLASYELVREFSPRDVGIIFDVGNAKLFGYQPWPQALDILFEYISHVHAKDLAWVRDGDKVKVDFTGPGEGFVEWADVLKLLKERGYDGYLSIEDYRGGWCAKNPEWPAERKAREWKQFLEGILEKL
ncbi:MAG: sugar phosphate isomerase/epimerase [Planctomycetes bacterium]|nr:sugar phosphate isomerase/epimerase [Planctomycetota bacterium]